MHLLPLLLFATQVLSPATDAPARGSLCLSDPGALMVARHCKSVEGTSFAVQKDPEERVYAWISSDESTVVLGTAPADADTVALPEAAATMSLELEGSPDRDWPQTTAVTVGTRETPALWRIELSEREALRLRKLVVPVGTWDLRFKALRHAVSALPFLKIQDGLDLGTITLHPLPQIRANVIDREGEFIRSALMLSNDRAVLATSGNFGEIVYEAPCEEETNDGCILPRGFVIEYPGTPPAWFAVTNRKRDFDVGTLRLAKGGTLLVELDRSAVKSPLIVEVLDDATAQSPRYLRPNVPLSQERFRRWELRREAADVFAKPPFFPLIASAALTEDESSVRFDNLPEGQLRLVIRGEEQGEYLSRFFNVGPEETREMEIAIQPAKLTVDVSRDGKDLEGISVEITQWDAPWHSVRTPPTDLRGKASVRVWEKGRHSARVVDSTIRAATLIDIGEQKEQTVTIHVVPASISGRVVEATTEKPVAGVAVLFDDLFYGFDAMPEAVTDDDGRFAIESSVPGLYRAELRADGFLPAERGGVIRPGHNDLGSIRMGRGVPYRVKVLWDDGTPIPGAVYLEKSDLYGVHVADENGEITFNRAIPTGPIPFWIVPEEGSFARGERAFDQEITIQVQQPGENLILNFEDGDEEPVDFAHFSFMWDGHPISRVTRLAIESIQNKRFRSDSASRLTLEGMPPGRYTIAAMRSFAGSPWMPEYLWSPVTTVHFSGAEQTANVIVAEPPPKH